jgi:hypothetical protein
MKLPVSPSTGSPLSEHESIIFESSSVDDALAFPFKASEKLYDLEIASTAHRATIETRLLFSPWPSR